MKEYEVVIIGGGLAGLSCGLVLGRSLIKTCVVSSTHIGEAKDYMPHNFISNDNRSLKMILDASRADLAKYQSVTQMNDKVVSVIKGFNGFEITLSDDSLLLAKRVVFATGLNLDFENAIAGFEDCFGVSIFNCPFCHGYEIQGKRVGVMGEGDNAMSLSKILSRWSDEVIVFDKNSEVNSESIVSDPLELIIQENGHIKNVITKSRQVFELDYLFVPNLKEFVQPALPTLLGLELVLNPQVDMPVYPTDQIGRSQLQNTYIIGDLRTGFSTLVGAANEGNILGMVITGEIASEE